MQRDVLVAGETLVDVVSGADGSVVEQPGGSAANAAVALARLGVRASLATSWGDDERGAELADHLAVEGVRVVGDPMLLARTSTAHASVGADGAAHYAFDVEWDLPQVSEVEPPQVLMLCSLAPLVEPGATKVRELLGLWKQSTVVYDLNIRPGITGVDDAVRRAAEHVAAQAHLVKASDEDLAALWPDLGLVAAAHHLLRLGARAVVVTRGPAGAMWVQRGRLVAEPAVRVERVADTIGAGDTFGAALVAWLLEHVGVPQQWDGLLEAQVREALAWASAAAAVTVSRPGADPPTRADLEAASS